MGKRSLQRNSVFSVNFSGRPGFRNSAFFFTFNTRTTKANMTDTLNAKKRKADGGDAFSIDLSKLSKKQLKHLIADAKEEYDKKKGNYFMLWMDAKKRHDNYVLYMKIIEREGPVKKLQDRLILALCDLYYHGEYSSLQTTEEGVSHSYVMSKIKEMGARCGDRSVDFHSKKIDFDWIVSGGWADRCIDRVNAKVVSLQSKSLMTGFNRTSGALGTDDAYTTAYEEMYQDFDLFRH